MHLINRALRLVALLILACAILASLLLADPVGDITSSIWRTIAGASDDDPALAAFLQPAFMLFVAYVPATVALGHGSEERRTRLAFVLGSIVPAVVGVVLLTVGEARMLNDDRSPLTGITVIVLSSGLAATAGLVAASLRTYAGLRRSPADAVERTTFVASTFGAGFAFAAMTGPWTTDGCTAGELLSHGALCLIAAAAPLASRAGWLVCCAFAVILIQVWAKTARDGEALIFIGAFAVCLGLLGREPADARRTWWTIAGVSSAVVISFAVGEDAAASDLTGAIPLALVVVVSALLLAAVVSVCDVLLRTGKQRVAEEQSLAWIRMAFLLMAFVITASTWMTGFAWPWIAHLTAAFALASLAVAVSD